MSCLIAAEVLPTLPEVGADDDDLLPPEETVEKK
jgi:hypothetical protein